MPDITEEDFKSRLAQVHPERRQEFMAALKDKGYSIKEAAVPAASGTSVLDTQIPGLRETAQIMGEASDLTQQAGEQVAGGLAKRFPSHPGLAAAAGAPLVAASAGLKLGQELVPATVKDVGMLMATEGAGLAGRALGETALGRPVAKVASRVLGTELGPMATKAYESIPGLKPAVDLIRATVPKAKVVLRDTANYVGEQAVAAGQALGMKLTPAQLIQSPTLQMFDRLASKFPFASDLINSVKLQQVKTLDLAKQDLISTLGRATPGDVGPRTMDEVSERVTGLDASRLRSYQTQREVASRSFPGPELPEGRSELVQASEARLRSSRLTARKALYDRARAELPDPVNARLSGGNLQQEAAKVVAEYGTSTPKNLKEAAYATAADLARGPQVEAVGNLDQKLIKLVKDRPEVMAQLPPDVQQALKSQGSYGYDQFDTIIQRLRDKAQGSRLPNGDYTSEGRQYVRLTKAAEADRDAFFAQHEVADQKYQVAKAFHADYSERHRSTIIQKLYGDNPRSVFEAVVAGGHEADTRRLVSALGSDGRAAVKRQLFDQVFGSGEAIPETDKVVKNLAKYGPSIRGIFTQDEQRSLQKFALDGEAPKFLRDEFETRVRSLLKHGPEKIPGLVLSGDVNVARAVKRFTSRSTFDGYGQLLAQEIVQGTQGALEQGTSGILKRLNGYDDAYLSEFFNRRTIEGMRQIGSAEQLLKGFEDLAQRPVVSKDGAIAFGVMGLMLNPSRLVGGGLVGLVVTPPTLAKMYLSDAGRGLITTLMRMPAADPRLPQLVARIAQMGLLHRLHAGQGGQPR